jgi:hypothetical protein
MGVTVNLWLFGGLAALLTWALLTFVIPAGTGLIHILLGVGLVAVVVWWARRPDPREVGP